MFCLCAVLFTVVFDWSLQEPWTDLRSTGMLSLLQMLGFAQKHRAIAQRFFAWFVLQIVGIMIAKVLSLWMPVWLTVPVVQCGINYSLMHAWKYIASVYWPDIMIVESEERDRNSTGTEKAWQPGLLGIPFVAWMCWKKGVGIPFEP